MAFRPALPAGPRPREFCNTPRADIDVTFMLFARRSGTDPGPREGVAGRVRLAGRAGPASRVREGRSVTFLAGRGADRPAVIRAHAALAAVKGGTMAALDFGDGTLTPDGRAEILALALRTLRAPQLS